MANSDVVKSKLKIMNEIGLKENIFLNFLKGKVEKGLAMYLLIDSKLSDVADDESVMTI